MGLFDTVREKAAELLSGATEKVSELAGDLPGADMLEDLSQSATDEAEGAVQDLGDSASDAATDATDSVTNATDSVTDATDSVTNATDSVTGSFTDTPDDPRQP